MFHWKRYVNFIGTEVGIRELTFSMPAKEVYVIINSSNVSLVNFKDNALVNVKAMMNV